MSADIDIYGAKWVLNFAFLYSKVALVFAWTIFLTSSPDAILFKIGGNATKYKHSKTATTTKKPAAKKTTASKTATTAKTTAKATTAKSTTASKTAAKSTTAKKTAAKKPAAKKEN